MAKGASSPVPFARTPQPLIDGGGDVYLQNELRAIETALASSQTFLPYATKKAPEKLVDGMIRLSRNPWRPVLGQVADQWVYYDAAGGIWRILGTAPTNT